MQVITPKAIYENRADAGRQLAAKLKDYAGQAAVVLAIPNGGVPAALQVAASLNADFDVVVSRKIPMPLNPEAGFGAIADDGTMILNEDIVKRTGLSPQQVEMEANKVRAEVKRRTLLYKGNRSLVSLYGRTVIIVDDGLASGVTMVAAVTSVRHRRPKETIVAVPCASASAVVQVEKVADKVVAGIIGDLPRFAVADYYHHWVDVKDDQVIRALSEWRMQRAVNPHTQ
ncbi:MAG: phosphoribosyl transferase [Chloroflexi bacterium]|nr:phosphoribosyl transferase [Chloroflexota bacterium]